MTSKKEQEYLEILKLEKQGEQKLKEFSEMATNLAKKCKQWYKKAISKKR